MKKRTRNILLIAIGIIAVTALALADIISRGKLTSGFLGMLVLILGALIIPAAIELKKESENR